MALQNQISISFTEQELQQLDEHIAGIEDIVKSKMMALTAEQNGLYGKLGNENEGWAATVYADCKQVSKLVPADVVDMKEWDKDALARQQLSPRVSRLEAVITDMESTNRMLGFDLYNTCLTVYKYVKTGWRWAWRVLRSFTINGACSFPVAAAVQNQQNHD